MKLLEPATKWNTQIQDPKSVPASIRKAFRLAQMEKPGSVAIILPENFAAEQILNEPLPVTPTPETVPDVTSLQAAKELIQMHSRPFIVIGNGVIRQEAAIELETFINTLQAPCIHSFMSKGYYRKIIHLIISLLD